MSRAMYSCMLSAEWKRGHRAQQHMYWFLRSEIMTHNGIPYFAGKLRRSGLIGSLWLAGCTGQHSSQEKGDTARIKESLPDKLQIDAFKAFRSARNFTVQSIFAQVAASAALAMGKQRCCRGQTSTLHNYLPFWHQHSYRKHRVKGTGERQRSCGTGPPELRGEI
eukprot:1159756-Pelagomonas_calceolata.AAC.1